MLLRIRIVSLLFAWFCASGALLDVTQVCAWAHMFAGYVRTESISAAAAETMDPNKPCELCRAVRKARDESKQSQPAIPAGSADRLVLSCERPAAIIVWSPPQSWPESRQEIVRSWTDSVPVPPPRAIAA